jgi:hypothetical protein
LSEFGGQFGCLFHEVIGKLALRQIGYDLDNRHFKLKLGLALKETLESLFNEEY